MHSLTKMKAVASILSFIIAFTVCSGCRWNSPGDAGMAQEQSELEFILLGVEGCLKIYM